MWEENEKGLCGNSVCKFIATCTEEVNLFHEANLIFTYLVLRWINTV